MCGVVTYVGAPLSEAEAALVAAVLRESGVRGLHAAGFAAGAAGALRVEKFATAPVAAAALDALVPRPEVVLAHTRYSTSGDWADPTNNQPLAVEDALLVFNGCIDMGPRSEWEARDGRRYATENDGELFLRRVLDGADWAAYVATGAFSFAGAFAHRGAVWAIRNARRPLWRCPVPGGTLLASTRDILRRAGLDVARAEEVAPCVPLRLL